MGEYLGEAYQVADDIGDAAADPEALGKPVGQDAALGRPSAVATFGLNGAIDRLEDLASAAAAAIPRCPGEEGLRKLIRSEAHRLVPKHLARTAA
jgi:geranylgeranyl diphosphate synthase type II